MEQQPIIDGETGMAGLGALFGDPEKDELIRVNNALRMDLNGCMQEMERLNQENIRFREVIHNLDVQLNEEKNSHRVTKDRKRETEWAMQRYERIIDHLLDALE